MKILVNSISTKKHSGGAYQIAYNFLLKTQEHNEVDWVYVVSSDLDEILPASIKESQDYYVFPTQPDYLHTYAKVRKELKELEHRIVPDVVYSITSPSYFTFDTVEVMRFTMPWVTHPNKYSWSVLSFNERVRMRLYCWNQRRLLRKARFFITQTETTRQGIIRITGTAPENVKVVNNVLPSVFLKIDDTPLSTDGKWVNIACVGNPSAHKNFSIIPYVLDALRDYGIANVRFHVTIPENSPRWVQIQKTMRVLGLTDGIVNYGRVSQLQLANLYRQCQLCFLPTLLEVFSASTVEAMYFHLPIVATDFDFNREVMADSCLYYEPQNAKAAAYQIKKYIENVALCDEMRQKMKRRLSCFCDYDKHFNDIVDFLETVSKKAL